MAQSKNTEQAEQAVADTQEKATPLKPGPPQRVPSALGSTFAERQAARVKNKAVQDSEAK